MADPQGDVLEVQAVWADTFEDMMAFVASRSGGIEGRFLLYLAAFHRNHVDFTRTSLPSVLYRALADFHTITWHWRYLRRRGDAQKHL